MVESEWVLSRFGAHQGRARSQYLAFVLDGIGVGHREEFYDLKEQRFLGDTPFVEKINRRLDVEPPRRVKVELSTIEDMVCRRFQCPVESLYSRSKDRQGSLARAVIGYVGHELGTVKLAEIGRRYGRDQVTVSLGIKRLRERMGGESDLRKSVAALVQQVRGGKTKLNN
jgi:chromosomal replication initiation ATPase DnaA